MKKYFKHIKKNPIPFILGPIFMICEACGEFILPYINANIINVGAVNGDINYILQNGLFMAFIALFMLVTGVAGAYFSIQASTYLASEIREDVFGKITQFSFSNIDEFTTGSLITRITNDVTQIQNFAQNLLRGMFRAPIMLIGALVMSFLLQPSLALIILIVMPVLACLILLIIKTASPRYTRMQKSIDHLNGKVNETITNQKVIKSFVREEYEIGRFLVVNEELVEKSTSALKVMLLLQPISALAIHITTLAVIWGSGRNIMIGTMEIGTLTAFITYLTQVLNALNFLANIILTGVRAGASHRRISEVLEAEVSLQDENAKYKEKRVEEGSITFKEVSFRYYKQNKEKVLEKISFHIRANEMIGIVGTTGSGKTTLVSLIDRLYDCDEGEVLVDGVNVKDYSLKNLREDIAVVLQKNTLFSGTIYENLCWGKEDATQEEVEYVCKIAQAHDFIMEKENGYESVVEQGGSNFSGGQKQRLCIARALLKKPKILILDDSTSAVDTKTDASIRKAFRNELKDTTKIIIAQRITSIMDADKILVLEKGKLVGFGNHETLLQNCKAYQEIYYSQKEKEEA